MKPVYSVVIPAYNEEEVIITSYQELKRVMDQTNESYELIFINDGSRDKTLEILTNISDTDGTVRIINFSRNFGHQIAITAGMDNAFGDAILVIDADLQDPPEVMLQMIEKWKAGYEVVYGKRLKRAGETWFKKATASLYYRFLGAMTTVDIPVDTGDFRLIDRKVCEALKSIKEKNRYVRGLVSWVGFKQTAVEYDRHQRFAGETKYPLKKMVKLAFDGLTSFSNKLLKLPTAIGVILCVASGLYILYHLFLGSGLQTAPFGFLAIPALFFMQGLLFIMLGLLGEYMGRIYDETRDRPLYIISEIIQNPTAKLKGAQEDEGNTKTSEPAE